MYLTQALHRNAQLNPDKVVTINQDRQQTWRHLRDRVARLAGALQQLGVSPGDRVAILALNSDRYLETYLAVPWAGGVIVPMNIRWSVPEHVYSLHDAGAEILLVDDTFKGAAQAIQQQGGRLRAIIFMGDGPASEGMLPYESVLAAAQPVADALRMNDDLAGIFYTGGTTGFPKGVMLSHKALWSNALSTAHEADFQPDTVYLHAAPMFHLADGAGSNAALLVGATHVFLPAFNPEQVLRSITQHRVSHTVLVPTMIKLLLEHPVLGDSDLTSLKRFLYGASPIPEAILLDAFQKLPNCGFLQAYGQTELAPVATILPPAYHVLDGPNAGKLRSCGRPTYTVEVKIVGLDNQEVPRGEIGEIIVRGPNTMVGYWNKPEETARTLVDGWVHTGDMAYMDADGFVFIMDRLKDMIISGGENVYSAETENAVMKHPAVRDCVVIGVPDTHWGERVHALVILKPGAQATAEELLAHCHTLIAGYKCPRSIEFRMEPFPVSGAGKILKRELRKPYWEGQARQVH